jgi:hypothetical protein
MKMPSSSHRGAPVRVYTPFKPLRQRAARDNWERHRKQGDDNVGAETHRVFRQTALVDDRERTRRMGTHGLRRDPRDGSMREPLQRGA